MNFSAKKNFGRLTKIRWIARFASILSILVLLMFFIGEGFDVSSVTARQWAGLLFFPFGLVAGFVVGWKNEILGGTISIVSLFCFYLVYGLLLTGNFPRGVAFLIFSLPAFLFLAAGIYAEATIGRPGNAEVKQQTN